MGSILLAINTYLLGPALLTSLFFGIAHFAWTGTDLLPVALAAGLLVLWVPVQVLFGLLAGD